MASIAMFKRGDTAPRLEVVVRDRHGAVADLSEVSTVRFLMRERGGRGMPLIDAPGEVLSVVEGLVGYQWQPGDLHRPGAYSAEFEFTKFDGRVLTVPTRAYVSVLVVDDLDAEGS